MPRSLGPYRKLVARYGFHIAMQTVIENGQRYRRVAVVLAPKTHTPTRTSK
ncbi:hypothetical protein [Caudoviricetes sp.]|nr:hypothetical protein [Caudoviricetes sp.]UOF81864.1 hypothetical protein [Caudoviricetes sp.]